MKLLDINGVPSTPKKSMPEPTQQYRFSVEFPNFEEAGLQVNSVDILYNNNYITLNISMRDAIGMNLFNKLVKYSKTSIGENLKINQTDGNGDAISTINGKIISFQDISMKLDYACPSNIEIKFAMRCFYNDNN